MGLLRILVDGYSLLHAWPEIAPGRARHSEAARNDLASILTRYQDASGIAVTVVFDGAGPRPSTTSTGSSGSIEILFSKTGQTADDLIERAAYRLKEYGEVLVVTDDYAERDTVFGFGVSYSSCFNFAETIRRAFDDLNEDLRRYNNTERRDFRNSRS